MHRATKTLLLLSPLITALLLAIALFTTSPVTIGPGGVMGVFVLIYTFTLSVLFVLLHFGINWLNRLRTSRRGGVQKEGFRIGARKAYYIASVLAFVPVLLLAMRSFANLHAVDVVLVCAFALVAIFYILKRA